MEADMFYNLIKCEQQEKFYGLNTLAEDEWRSSEITKEQLALIWTH